jgi:hypothetical protein
MHWTRSAWRSLVAAGEVEFKIRPVDQGPDLVLAAAGVRFEDLDNFVGGIVDWCGVDGIGLGKKGGVKGSCED